ncbi:hypothetical protein PMAYCL1PPCAC_02207, partial [Pristionchus mayeri]
MHRMRFVRSTHLAKHVQTHLEVREKFECEECKKSYTSLQSLKDHQKTHSVDDGVRFDCETCGKSFRWRASLREHKKMHRGEENPRKKTIQCE